MASLLSNIFGFFANLFSFLKFLKLKKTIEDKYEAEIKQIIKRLEKDNNEAEVQKMKNYNEILKIDKNIKVLTDEDKRYIDNRIKEYKKKYKIHLD